MGGGGSFSWMEVSNLNVYKYTYLSRLEILHSKTEGTTLQHFMGPSDQAHPSTRSGKFQFTLSAGLEDGERCCSSYINTHAYVYTYHATYQSCTRRQKPRRSSFNLIRALGMRDPCTHISADLRGFHFSGFSLPIVLGMRKDPSEDITFSF